MEGHRIFDYNDLFPGELGDELPAPNQGQTLSYGSM